MIGDPLEFLVARRCPEVAPLASPDLRPSDRKALEKKVASFRGQLKGMPPEEFRSLFKKERENWHLELRGKNGIIEESCDFMSPMYNADLAKWGAEASWTIDEAGALMIGKDPDTFPWDQVTSLRHGSPMFKRICDFRRSALRVAEQQKWKQLVPPAKLLAWAADRGFEFPPELVAKVHAQEAPSPRDDDLSDDKLSPREISSLLKLAIAVAIARYRHDPRRGATAMESDVKALKMDLTAATIAKLLKIAAEKVDFEDVATYFADNPIKPPVRLRRRHPT
ncbi:MAG: hypothetical protein WA624_14825 [Methylocella sp.]